MQNLQPNTILQNGKYKIIEMLGQGGFGITYLAMQSGLERKVAIKEFFMKENCERDPETSHVTLGTEGGRETVLRYREKFMKEARNIAKLSHKNIVRIIDVFEENNTSYYVMEYVENGSLADKVNREGYLSEPVATRYILQVADALDYIHQQKMSHLDVKPANIMLNAKDETVLIDFGLSKQYDAATGNQTSSTPVGISEGFAPMEQYKKGGVGEFSPKTDIYSLGATFFCLLTGVRPPSASDVFEDGLPIEKLKARGVSQKAINIICKAMEGRKKDRLDDVAAFINGLKQEAGNDTSDNSEKQKENGSKKDEDGDTILKSQQQPAEQAGKKMPTPKKAWIKRFGIAAAILIIIGVLSAMVYALSSSSSEDRTLSNEDTTEEAQQLPAISTAPLSEKTFTVGGVTFIMMPVQGGTFTMGATSEQQSPDSDEKPTHRVSLSSYYIGKYEVTQALWKAVMGSNPSKWKGDNLPVEQVSWDDCQTFLRKLNAMTGKNFRLPTEAEWEYAARGGNRSRGYQYSGSNNLSNVAWYDDNSGSKTHPVGTKAPNELGIYDMSGNVWEWCQDWYGNYTSSAQTNPTGSSSGSCRVDRGGSWLSHAWDCRVAYRLDDAPDNGSINLGLRLALSQ
ncbi:MAG: bifunctional serine/threonine-protein kinase/formylglycine-generating enzyme family protein [Prevotella sp.]